MPVSKKKLLNILYCLVILIATQDGKGKTKDKYQIPVACDRIYLMDNAKSIDWGIENVSIFGTDISLKTGFSPSDHYGVLAEVAFN